MKDINKKKIVIVVLLVIGILIIGLGIYLIIIKKDENIDSNSVNSTKFIEKNYGYYSIISGKSYEIFSNYDGDKKYVETYNLSYPKINIKSNDVDLVNNEIKKMYDNIEKKYNEVINKGDSCICVLNGVNYNCDNDGHLSLLDYEILEDDKIITIIVKEDLHTYCASGYSVNFYVATLNKENGQLIRKNEILSMFTYSEDEIKQDITKYIAENIDNSYKPDELDYFVVNNNVIINCRILGEYEYLMVSKDKTGKYIFDDFDISEYLSYSNYGVADSILDSKNNSVYKTKDGNNKLMIISKDNLEDYNKALKEFKNGYEKYYKNQKYDNIDVLSYGYLNDNVIEIDEITKEDDTYVLIKGEYLPSVVNDMSGSKITIMINKVNNTIIIPVDAEDDFHLGIYDISYIKINNNYFFLYYYVDGGPDDGVAIYTDKWIKLGYVKKNNIKSDNDGIYVYENKNLTGDLIKYDNNGIKQISLDATKESIEQFLSPMVGKTPFELGSHDYISIYGDIKNRQIDIIYILNILFISNKFDKKDDRYSFDLSDVEKYGKIYFNTDKINYNISPYPKYMYINNESKTYDVLFSLINSLAEMRARMGMPMELGRKLLIEDYKVKNDLIYVNSKIEIDYNAGVSNDRPRILNYVIVLGFKNNSYYIKEVIDNNGNKQVKEDVTKDDNSNVLSSDEALKIAKEKLDAANKFSSENICWKEGIKKVDDTRWCYYDTLDSFKERFYNIFSEKLLYKDVFIEYKSLYSTTDWSTNVKLEGDMLSSMPGYVINNNKVYRDSCAVGSGDYERMDKFNINNVTSSSIEVNYVIIGNSNPYDSKKSLEYEISKATIILVKENNEWKILKATIVDLCDGVYEIGK